jgi:hypothetical protein
MTIRILAAAAFLCSVAATSHAQQPLAVGSATALGDAAVTEARRTDAAWNPALAAIYDGPLSSYSLLAVDLSAAPAGSWARPARSLGLDGLPSVLGRLGAHGAGGGAFGAGGVQWLATQHREFVISISSHYVAGGGIPEAIGASFGDAPAAAPSGGDSTVRASSTVLAITRGAYLGKLPLLGGLWLGATAKGWWVHSYARGAFRASTPGEDVYREVVLRNVPGYGLDLGVVAQPVERVSLGASVTNVFSAAVRPKNGPRVRTVSVLPGEGGVEVTASYGPFLGTADDSTEDAGLARDLWESASFPAVLRAGGTVETDAGSFSAAARSTLSEGGLDPEWDAARYTLAYRGPAAFPVSASYAYGNWAKTVGLGVRVGGCQRRWNLGLVRRSGAWGAGYGGSLSVSIGSAAGCDVFRS